MRNAAEGNIAEVKLGKLAEEKGQSEEVKKFGKRMVEGHGKAQDELKQIGSRERINLPTDWSRKHAETYDRLAKLSGPAFDKAYARDMVQDHEQDINEYKRATHFDGEEQFAETVCARDAAHPGVAFARSQANGGTGFAGRRRQGQGQRRLFAKVSHST